MGGERRFPWGFLFHFRSSSSWCGAATRRWPNLWGPEPSQGHVFVLASLGTHDLLFCVSLLLFVKPCCCCFLFFSFGPWGPFVFLFWPCVSLFWLFGPCVSLVLFGPCVSLFWLSLVKSRQQTLPFEKPLGDPFCFTLKTPLFLWLFVKSRHCLAFFGNPRLLVR